MPDLFNLSSYTLNGAALPPLVVGVLIAFLGILYYVREGHSSVASPFSLMTSSAAVWLIGTGLAQSIIYPLYSVAYFRLAQVGLIAFSVSFLWFSVAVTAPGQRLRQLVGVAAAAAIPTMLLAALSPAFVSGIERLPWGLQPAYGLAGSLFAGGFVALMLTCLGLYQWRLGRSNLSQAMRKRAWLLTVAALLGLLMTAIFLPAHGIEVAPHGHWVMGCFFLLTSYVAWRYRLRDITPAYVGAQIANAMQDALLVLDRAGIVRMANHAACELLNLPAAELIGRDVTAALGSDLLADQHKALLEGRRVRDVELEYSTPEQQPRTLSVSAATIREHREAPRAFTFILRDVSSRKEAEERIRQLAFFDELTALPNRAEFQRRLENQLVRARRRNQSLCVLFLDLDRFKRINDTLGHDAGDSLLRIASERLRTCVRGQQEDRSAGANEENFIARLGGDEFVICLGDVANPEQVRAICKRILAAISEPIELAGHEIFTSTTIGVSRYPEDAQDVGALLKCADLAMYQAKEAGRNHYRFYDASIETVSREQLILESDMRRALENDEFELFYQPLVDQQTQSIAMAEALLRWNHPTRGSVSPRVFLPVAEEAGVMPQIGEWVLRQACAQVRQWQSAGHTQLRVAVNLGERQFFRRNLCDVVASVLADTALAPELLQLELTEEIVMRDFDQSLAILEDLSGLGVKLAIDDFGTGHSALSVLRRLPIDLLKIDGAFTRGIATNSADGAITRAIIAMAKSLELEIVAEGIENCAQVNFLAAEGCHLMQGYLFGRPLPRDEFGRALDAASDAYVVPGNVLRIG